jgi:hypothetical protein
MGPFEYKGERYFVEEFIEDCPNAEIRFSEPSWKHYPTCPKTCLICKGDGQVIVTRWFKEIKGDPREGH